LEVLFVDIYNLIYADDDERELVATASIVVHAVLLFMIWRLRALMATTGMVVFATVQAVILILLALAAIIRHRVDKHRADYESLE